VAETRENVGTESVSPGDPYPRPRFIWRFCNSGVTQLVFVEGRGTSKGTLLTSLDKGAA
jgi:hypothetical protein